MNKFLLIFFFLINFNTYAQATFTERSETIGKNKIRINSGFQYLHKNELTSTLLADNQIRYFISDVRYGISDNVDFILSWRGLMGTKLINNGYHYDWGDLRIKTKFSFINENEYFPSLGLLSSIKLPNATYSPSKIGSNETDFELALLFSKTFNNFIISFNTGAFINGDPNYLAYQYDLYLYGLCITYSTPNVTLFSELYGTYATQHIMRKSQLKFGLLFSVFNLSPSITFNFRVLGNNKDYAPLFEQSEDFGVTLLISKTIEL
ncbi:MAG: hypothetical protein V1773_14090 [bacterium]